MKISELPKEIREKALEYQKEASSIWNKTTDKLLNAFRWSITDEKELYWANLHYSEPETEIKPTQYQIGIDTFERMESNCTLEERLAFVRGNIDKYNWRKKEQDKQDFEKIINYANWALKQLENGK